ncbi:hypothetical protein MTO96_047067, partial [Rhipicephalus appendiculatus]
TLRRQVAWVTGAGSGVGRATALELASHGVKVVLSDLDEQAIEDVKYTLVGKALPFHLAELFPTRAPGWESPVPI